MFNIKKTGISFLFPQSYTPRWIVYLLDIIICFISITLAYYIRFNFNLPDVDDFSFIIPFVLFIRALTFLIFRPYAGIVRYTSVKDTERIFIVILTGSLVFVIFNIINYYFISGQYIIPFSVIIIDFFTAIFLMAFSRLIIKGLYNRIFNPSSEKSNVVIFGAAEFGTITKRTLDRDAGTKHKVIAFFDDNESKIGKNLENVTIYSLKNLEIFLVRYNVEKLIIAKRDIEPEVKNTIIDICLNSKTSVLTVPAVNTWINGELSFNQLKNIEIEDLLERKPIVLDEKQIKRKTLNKTILVTGAAGSIGSEIIRQLIRFKPKKIILFDHAETPLYDLELELKEKKNFDDFNIIIGSISNKSRINYIFSEYQPSIVYHAAAYKHVPMMEANPPEAVRTNIIGTKNLADLSVQYNVEQFVLISTDKAVNPTNIMGASKRIAEMYIQALNSRCKTNFTTTRFGNVLGSNGSVILRFKKQIDEGGPLTVTHPEVTRYFMTIPEACQLVLEAGAMSKGGEIFLFDMGKSVKIIDLAKKMVKLSGLEIGKDIQIKYTGLRPGEKLYEELLNDTENTLPTYHSKIMIAKVRNNDYENLKQAIENIQLFRKENNNNEIVKRMKEIVPEFISQNSQYEEFDIR
ncbi:MAG: polysaccharide biosynthesis protein [Bacteroidota bacterium]